MDSSRPIKDVCLDGGQDPYTRRDNFQGKRGGLEHAQTCLTVDIIVTQRGGGRTDTAKILKLVSSIFGYSMSSVLQRLLSL